MPLAAGTKLGPYEIIRLLGAGGMGEVYRARDTRLGRDVAVKMLTSIVANDKEQITRFAQEARATGMLNHPNLLTIFDLGTANGAPFIVSELLEGQTLRERLETSPIPLRKIPEYALQIANGLAAAHDKGIVHRDLKPDNIFITSDERVKILDFGIAKLTPQGQQGGGTFEIAATTPGMVLGTVGYMSPEQVRGENVDQRSDIFAFGTILYEMLSGRRAFKRDSSIETLSAILKEEPLELIEVNPQVPQALERVVRRCLEKNRERRFQSARDLAFHLESLASAASAATPAIATGARATPSAPAAAAASQPTPTTPNSPTVRLPTGAAAAAPPAARPQTAAAPRPRTAAAPVAVKKRRISSALLWALAVTAVLGAGYAGYEYAQLQASTTGEPNFHRLTFRRGEVRSARFSPDGEMVVYSAAWEGQPTELFIANRQNPESRALGIRNAEIASISKSAELAIILDRDRSSGVGVLATVPMVGGTPREIADTVVQADWHPDGTRLAAIRITRGTHRVEFPVGTVKYESPRAIRELRFAPAGDRLALLESRGGGVDLVVLDLTGGTNSLAHGWSHGAQGLAWSPDGESIWLTGTDSAAPPALHQVSADGEVSLVKRLTGSMRLNDISPSGRLLMTHSTWRSALMHQAPGAATERDVSWFDWSVLADLSRDGTTILFNETREGGGAKSSIYLRRSDGSAPIRIGEGYGAALSPDGKWALSHRDAKLVLVPTGMGEPNEIAVAGAFDLGATWLPDNKRVVIAGALPNKGYALHLIDTSTGAVRPISPEGIPGDFMRPFVASPDGRFVAGLSKENTMVLYPIDGGAAIPVPAAAGEIPAQWSADGAALYVYRPNALPAQVFKIDLATGTRGLWREFAATDPAGVYRIAPIAVTPDATAYAYNALRVLSDLYVLEW